MKDKKNIKDVKNVKDAKNNKSGQKREIHKKQIFIFIAIIVLLFAITLILNFNKITEYKNNIIGADELTKSENAQIGEKAIVTSAQEVKRITGTAPFDSNDEPGNDSSETNDIVRSFDEIRWNLDLTLGLKSGTTETSLTGGKINIKVDLPEDTADVVEWNLESMSWIENGNISEDVKTLTQIPGIGAKSAQRIILELKDKMKREQQIQELTKATKGLNSVKTKLEERIENEEKIQEAMAALQVLGYNKREIEKAFDKLAKEDMSTEELIRKGLTILGK